VSRASRFLHACRREPVDCTPIWFMRQAGRYMPEYRAIREKYSLLDMIRTPALAAEVTLQPVQAFDVDAAILFADILPILGCLGLDLDFVPNRGPVLANPIRDRRDIPTSAVVPVGDVVGTTLDAVAMVKKELAGTVPLIGFSGAPFTLACYAIEGGSSKDYLRAKTFMYREPEAWHRLMAVLVDCVSEYLVGQAEQGADALQIFDSWAGCLGPQDYETFVLPYSARVVAAAKATGVPVIHFATDTAGMLPLMRRLNSDVVGVDWRTNLAEAWDILGHEVAVQGNLDPALLLADRETGQRGASRILDGVQGRPGHIFNLGHGIHKQTDPEIVRDLVQFVHEHSSKKGIP